MTQPATKREVVGVWLTPQEKAELEALAERETRSVSGQVRYLILQAAQDKAAA